MFCYFHKCLCRNIHNSPMNALSKMDWEPSPLGDGIHLIRRGCTCPPTPLRYGDATQWRTVPGKPLVQFHKKPCGLFKTPLPAGLSLPQRSRMDEGRVRESSQLLPTRGLRSFPSEDCSPRSGTPRTLCFSFSNRLQVQIFHFLSSPGSFTKEF